MLVHCDDKDISAFLYNIHALADKKNIIINLCIYGHLVLPVIKPKLIKNNRYISGLATMIPLDELRYRYLVDFWSNRYGVKSDEEYILSISNNNVLQAAPCTRLSTTEIIADQSDSERIYISTEALSDGIKTTQTMLIAENNQELLAMLDSPSASTIIFSCAKQSEVQQLAIDCYQLRVKAGHHLKIVIRETQQCLRYSDEKFLLRAGINLISPFQVPSMRFMSQIEAMQGQILTRVLPQNLDSLMEYDLKYDSRGYLPNKEFTRYCTDIIGISSRSNINFVLVKLDLLPGMTAEECLRLCHMRREGDIVTACHKALYVLFSSVRQGDVEVALNNIFDLPSEGLFLLTRVFDTQYDIEMELKYIIKNAVIISEDILIKQAEDINLITDKQVSSRFKSVKDLSSLFAVSKKIEVKGK
jgi:cellulose biosynthesis protein BcsE